MKQNSNLLTPNPLKCETPNPLKGAFSPINGVLKGAFSHCTAVQVPFRGFRGLFLLTLLLLFLLTLFTTCKKDPNTFTVSFNANGGSGIMANQTFEKEVAQTLTTNAFAHSSLQFNGWATSATGDVVYSNGQRITVSCNLALYAKWTTAAFDCGSSTITDCQGNVYNTVQIGLQCWIKQNLKATKYDTNSERPNVMLTTSEDGVFTPYFTVSTLSHTHAGNLYNWAAAVALTDGLSQSGEFATKRQGICPNGWHVPTNAEWTTMQNYLIANGFNWDNSTSGNKTAKSLVEVSPGNNGTWNSYTGDGVPGCISDSGEPKRNATGFSALPTGYAGGSTIYELGFDASFWSSSSGFMPAAWMRGLYFSSALFYLLDGDDGNKHNAYSVRCVRD